MYTIFTFPDERFILKAEKTKGHFSALISESVPHALNANDP